MKIIRIQHCKDCPHATASAANRLPWGICLKKPSHPATNQYGIPSWCPLEDDTFSLEPGSVPSKGIEEITRRLSVLERQMIAILDASKAAAKDHTDEWPW